jgi:hypothetical protein
MALAVLDLVEPAVSPLPGRSSLRPPVVQACEAAVDGVVHASALADAVSDRPTRQCTGPIESQLRPELFNETSISHARFLVPLITLDSACFA